MSPLEVVALEKARFSSFSKDGFGFAGDRVGWSAASIHL